MQYLSTLIHSFAHRCKGTILSTQRSRREVYYGRRSRRGSAVLCWFVLASTLVVQKTQCAIFHGLASSCLDCLLIDNSLRSTDKFGKIFHCLSMSRLCHYNHLTHLLFIRSKLLGCIYIIHKLCIGAKDFIIKVLEIDAST